MPSWYSNPLHPLQQSLWVPGSVLEINMTLYSSLIRLWAMLTAQKRLPDDLKITDGLGEAPDQNPHWDEALNEDDGMCNLQSRTGAWHVVYLKWKNYNKVHIMPSNGKELIKGDDPWNKIKRLGLGSKLEHLKHKLRKTSLRRKVPNLLIKKKLIYNNA